MRAFRPEAVKHFVAVLWKDSRALGEALRRLRNLWGPTDFEGPDRIFDLTDYYREEMGPGLRRRLLSFRDMASPGRLVERKLAAMHVERALCGRKGRRVNIDTGYLDVHKVVLASVKYGGQKIYLERGVYADMVCRYSKGRFDTFAWTFPDFVDGRYDDDLLAIRALYKTRMRSYNTPD